MKTVSTPINGLAAFRQKMGLTQLQLALHLGISVSMIKQVETYRKSLSSKCLVKLAVLEIQIETFRQNKRSGISDSMNKIFESNTNNYAFEMEYLVKRNRYHTIQFEKKLLKMEQEHEQLKSSLLNIAAIETMNTDSSDSLKKLIMIARPKLERKLNKCSIHAQVLLRRKINILYSTSSINNNYYPRYVHTTTEKPIISPLKQSNMSYSLSLISNKADCQTMLNMANDDKEALAYRKIGLTRQNKNNSENSVSIEAELAAATAEVDALNTVIAGLPEGNTKEDMKVKLTKAEYKKFLLGQRKGSYGTIALLEKEYEIACIDLSIAETDSFIAALTTRLSELPTT